MHVAIISHKNGSSYGGSSSIILEHKRWNLAKNNKIRSVWKSTPKYLFIRDGALCEFVADNTSHNTTRYPVDLYSIKVKSSALVSLCFDWTSYNKHKKLLYFVATLLLMWGSRIQSHYLLIRPHLIRQQSRNPMNRDSLLLLLLLPGSTWIVYLAAITRIITTTFVVVDGSI